MLGFVCHDPFLSYDIAQNNVDSIVLVSNFLLSPVEKEFEGRRGEEVRVIREY
jgi:hypothetical protein